MNYRFDEFLSALREVQRLMCEVEAWNDNDGCTSLNVFAFSEVGGERSLRLKRPIIDARHLASCVLRFNKDGLLNRRDLNAIREAGFEISSGCHDRFVTLSVPPTQQVIDEWEEIENQDEERDNGRHEPESMDLIIISSIEPSEDDDD